MKKELMAALLTVGFIFAGVMAASAGTITWTMIETNGMASHSPGADDLLGTPDDGTSAKCNYSNATACVVTGTPTTGAYSFAKLNFVQSSSCAIATGAHNPGDLCTDNASCGGVCVDCNSGVGGLAYSYFAKNPSAGAKGNGTMKLDACENGFEYTSLALGSSEVVAGTGGGCLTLTSGSGTTTSGCAVGSVSSTMSMDLWTSTIGSCGFKAGVMPGISTSGRIYDAGAAVGTAVCTYTVGEIGGIIAGAGLGSGDYLMIVCGNGTLPTDLQSACLPGASWQSVLVAKTSQDIAASCGEACSSGCMAGTAEGVE